MNTGLSTDAFAAEVRVKPQTIRAGYCRNGHYMGIRPLKLPNRLLLWPADAVARLLAGNVEG